MSTPTVSQEFGGLVGPWTIEAAARATVTTWLWPIYTQELERQNGLLPNTLPKPSVIVGAADLTAWTGRDDPCVLVVCEDPQGEPEYFQSAGYFQTYRLTVGAVMMAIGGGPDDEDTARMHVGLYTVALAGLMDQQFASDNPTLVQHVKRTVSPTVALPDPDERMIYLGQASYDVIVQASVVIEGPPVPLNDQESPRDWPTVQTEDLTVTAEPL